MIGNEPSESVGRSALWLGNFYYGHGRVEQAIEAWESADDAAPAILWRNLAVAYFNDRHDLVRARTAFDRAVAVAPADELLRYELDQFRKHVGDEPVDRLRELLKHPGLVRRSDRLAAELSDLYVLAGRPLDAIRIWADRPIDFDPYARARLAASRLTGDRSHFEGYLSEPVKAGSVSIVHQINYWLNRPAAEMPDDDEAAFFWAIGLGAADASPSLQRVVASRLLSSAEALLREPADRSFGGRAVVHPDVRASVLTAMAQILLGRNRQAIDLLDDVARIDPSNLTAFAVRATL